MLNINQWWRGEYWCLKKRSLACCITNIIHIYIYSITYYININKSRMYYGQILTQSLIICHERSQYERITCTYNVSTSGGRAWVRQLKATWRKGNVGCILYISSTYMYTQLKLIKCIVWMYVNIVVYMNVCMYKCINQWWKVWVLIPHSFMSCIMNIYICMCQVMICLYHILALSLKLINWIYSI
jgi:hypothetical protein